MNLQYSQANSNAREGRVMIYNLVEAAQEFLSEVVPQAESREAVSVSIDQFAAIIKHEKCMTS